MNVNNMEWHLLFVLLSKYMKELSLLKPGECKQCGKLCAYCRDLQKHERTHAESNLMIGSRIEDKISGEAFSTRWQYKMAGQRRKEKR